MREQDHYQVLGLRSDASSEDIRRAYRRLARRFHPDVSKAPDAEPRFKQIRRAYEVLRDPARRAAYDRGRNTHRGPAGGRQGWGEGFTSGPDRGHEPFDFQFGDFFEELMGGRPEAFAGAGGRNRRPESFTQGERGPGRRSRRRQTPTRRRALVAIRLEEAWAGTERDIRLPGGEGGSVRVRIPAGVVEGDRVEISVAGQGAAGASELEVEIELLPHPPFRVAGRDVYLDLPLAPWEAALGARVPVPTLGGTVNLEIPAGSQSGRRLRLRGRGLGRPGERGDQYAVAHIHTPPADTEDARAWYRRMAERLPFNPRAGLQ